MHAAEMMLTVLMECKSQEALIAQSLASLVSGAVQGLVAEVVLLDHGSSDGTAALADAVGCRHVENFQLTEVVANARGQWFLVIEPGARIMQSSWNDELSDYMGLGLGPARLSASPHYHLPIWKRIFSRKNPLELGLLISKDDLLRSAERGLNLRDIALTVKKRKLFAQIVPAWVLAASLKGSAAL